MYIIFMYLYNVNSIEIMNVGTMLKKSKQQFFHLISYTNQMGGGGGGG